MDRLYAAARHLAHPGEAVAGGYADLTCVSLR
jgi:hypothetical protein